VRCKIERKINDDGSSIDRIDPNQLWLVLKDGLAIALDGFHDMGRSTQPFVCDRGIEGSKIDRPHRLCPKHERLSWLSG
jgi:hypothetical protein